MKPLILAAALLASPAYAQHAAIAADGVSTAAALASGATELNPLGFATIPIRLIALEHAKSLPKEEGVLIEHSIGAAGWGAAVNNALVLIGAGPVALIAGLATGVYLWQQGQGEREFYAICAQERIYWNNPDMTCTFTPR